MHALLAVDSVHTAAAACDYLGDRLSADDRVTVVAVNKDGSRDAGDAANVAQVRLLIDDVTVEIRDGEPAAEIIGLAEERDIDEIVVGTHAGEPGNGPEVGETTISVLEGIDVPVVVVPVPSLDPE